MSAFEYFFCIGMPDKGHNSPFAAPHHRTFGSFKASIAKFSCTVFRAQARALDLVCYAFAFAAISLKNFHFGLNSRTV
jgi:hypothetical protein